MAKKKIEKILSYEQLSEILKIERKNLDELREKYYSLLDRITLSTATEIAIQAGFESAEELNEELVRLGLQIKVGDTYVLNDNYKHLESIKQYVLDNGEIIYQRFFTECAKELILEIIQK